MLEVPLSDTWRRRKAKRWLYFADFLKFVGLTSLIGGIALPWVIPLNVDQLIASIVYGALGGIVLLVIGFAIPYLEDAADVNCIPRVRFLGSGLLAIDGVSQEFLKELPTASAPWYHGLFGAEAIRLPEDDSQKPAPPAPQT